MKINEIFQSLQGEGYHTGIPSVFVRFSGCNKKCIFCDTSHESGKEMTQDEIFATVSGFNAPWVVLTGGEPALWINRGFVDRLKASTGKLVAIETNGSLPVPENIDWVTVSPKSGMVGAGDYDILAERADELKVVDTGQPLESYFTLKCVGAYTKMYLQPCFVKDKDECLANRRRTVARVIADPRWTLSVQMHRFMDIP